MMNLQLPEGAEKILNLTETYNFDNCRMLAYNLSDNDLQEVCERATESYARKVLKWPDGRLAKPEILEPVGGNTAFEDINSCLRHFVQHLEASLDLDSSKMLPILPEAFVVISKSDHASLVLLHKPGEQTWRADCVQVPIEVELCLTATSLMMGDETAVDVFGRLKAR